MPSFLDIEGYVFETEALKDAYHALPPSGRASTTGYDEESLRALVRYFADWGPARGKSLRDSAEETLDDLSADEKRDLYNTFVRELSGNLRDQYSRDAAEQEFEGFVHALSADPLPRPIATFLLRYLWQFSKRVHEYEQDLLAGEQSEATDDAVAHRFTEAIRRLPEMFLDSKGDQYEGEDKINGVRYRALDTIRSRNSLSLDTLQRYISDENNKYDKNIMQAYDEFAVLGGLYYSYFKPRINAYLHDITDRLIEDLDIKESTAHCVNFTAPRNRLNDTAWFAIYPTTDEDKADAYQLFTGIHWDSVRYGLYTGDELREEGWEEEVDIDRITEMDALTIDLLVEKFDDVLQRYYRLNGIETVAQPDEPPVEVAETVARQLDRENQVVFYGPPGTGKTYEAQRFAHWWVHDRMDGQPRDEQVESVTFHPSFAYEDFVEGLTAEATDTGDVEYQVEDGILKRIADNARRARERAAESGAADGPGDAPPYVLIIDEINRGNLAQIFGETITLLESDKRGSYEVSLAHSDESFTLPPNLYVIGTMNTADRSIALVDAALRRRFRFLPFEPDYGSLREHHGFDGRSGPVEELTTGEDGFRTLLGLSILAVEQLNERIVGAPDLSKGQQIGHSYLWDTESVVDIVDAWQYDILPLLEEYYFGQFERIRRQLFDGTGEELVDWEHERIREFDDEDLAAFLDNFVDIEGEVGYTASQSTDDSESGPWNPSPEFPAFLESVGAELVDEIGETLHADSLRDVHSTDHFDRLSLVVYSRHPNHPGGDSVRYRMLVRPHLNPPRIETNLAVDDERIRNQFADDIQQRAEESNLSTEGVNPDQVLSTVNLWWETDEVDGDPYELDGDELREAFGEDLVEDAKAGFVDLVETFHPLFAEADIDVEENE
jgi:5-methylcytosine-specific restriction protein B